MIREIYNTLSKLDFMHRNAFEISFTAKMKTTVKRDIKIEYN